ncbi:hypothetical protein GCM10009716_41570 [Streptomyces sodiiphilus]|uniref:Uncharacterized protein n=1 Tax=Streptomyces sodiiphilus TaxID=226217 RepID=A0ABN2PSB6_9ACTN
MGSLFEELEARESAERERVDALQAELAELTGHLEDARAVLERLRVTRETVAEVLAEMEPLSGAAPVADVSVGIRSCRRMRVPSGGWRGCCRCRSGSRA